MDADEGFVEFMSARRTRLFRLAYLLTADAAAAEDLVQTAMEKTYARWSKVSRMEAPEAYVRKLMVNAVISARRRPGWGREWLRAVLPERATPSANGQELRERCAFIGAHGHTRAAGDITCGRCRSVLSRSVR